MLDEAAIKGMKVAELKGELHKLNLPQSGKKEELVARLLEASAISSSKIAGVANDVDELGMTEAQAPHSPLSPHPPRSAWLPSTTPIASGEAAPPMNTGNSFEERLAERAARFNLPPSDRDRAMARRERFGSTPPDGLPLKIKTLAGVEVDLFDLGRMKQRQERFGTTTSSTLMREDGETQRIKRLQKFGLPEQN